MKRDETEDTPYVVMSTFFIHSYLVTLLFDSSASHSFVTSSVVNKLKLVPSYRSPPISLIALI